LPNLNVTSGGKQFFSLWTREADIAYTNLEKQLGLMVDSLRASGISDAAIFDRLKADIEANKDLFASYAGDIESADTDLVHLEAQLASNDEVSDAAEYFTWTLDPTAEHCGDCLANADKDAMSFADWQDEGLPGMGNTECGEYCKCSLDPVGEEFSSAFKPPTGDLGDFGKQGKTWDDLSNLEKKLMQHDIEAEAKYQADKAMAEAASGGFSKQTAADEIHLAKAEDVWAAGGTKREVGIVYDGDGKVVLDKTGKKSRVVFDQTEMARMKDNNFIHNHPNDSSFSGPDIYVAAKHGLKSVVAVGEDYIYIATPKGGKWPKISSLAQYETDWKLTRSETGKKYLAQYQTGKGEVYLDRTWQQHSHELNVKMAERWGFDYRRIKR
jgi:hypothetical protein